MHVDFNSTNNSILLTIVDLLSDYGELIIAEREEICINSTSNPSQDIDPELVAESKPVEGKKRREH